MKKKTNYADYDVYDFLKDEFFVLWATSDDKEVADFWERWLKENPAKQEEVHQARQILGAFDFQKKATLDEESYIELYESILKRDKIVSYKSNKLINGKFLYTVAATVAILIISLIAFKVSNEPAKVEQVVTIAKTTQPGEKKTIKLPDGSTVKINADSRLTYTSKYGQQVREVELEGEAFFEVVKNMQVPFVVRTSNMKVQVMGTSFNIKAYSGDVNNAVALASGKVKISTQSGAQPVFMRPGELAIADYKGQIELSEVDLSKYIDWKDGILTFEENDFESVITTLSRWYGVEFLVEGKIPLTDTFSGRFDNENLENVLRVLSYSSRFTYAINNKTVTIKF